MNVFDVIVIGAGAWGTSTAAALTERGNRVLLLDRYEVPHKLGSSHGHARVMSRVTDITRQPLLARAWRRWAALSAQSSPSITRPTQAVYVLDQHSSFLSMSISSRFGPKFELIPAPEAARRFPGFVVRPGELVLHYPQAFVLDPELYIEARLAAARRRGLTTQFAEPANQWTTTDQGVTVVTDRDEYRAERLVLAVGPWLHDLVDVALPITVERQVAVWFKARPGFHPVIFSVPCRPPATFLYGLPDRDGFCKVAFHHGGDSGQHPDTVDRIPGEADIARVQAIVRERVPLLDDEPLRAEICLYTNSQDLRFIVGVHPRHSNVFIAGADNGDGLTFAPSIGDELAEMVAGRGGELLTSSAPSRFARE